MKVIKETPVSSVKYSKDTEALLFLKGFLAITAMITSLFLELSSPLFLQRTWHLDEIEIPAIILLLTAIVVFMVCLRFLMFVSNIVKYVSVISVLGLLGGCLSPLGILSDSIWGVFIPLVALGTVSVGFLWLLYLTDLSHRLLLFLVSVSIAISAGILLALYSLELSLFASTVLQCVLMLIAWIFLAFRSKTINPLLCVSATESKKHAVSAQVDRWTYSIIGIDFGFGFGLMQFEGSELIVKIVPQTSDTLLLGTILFVPTIAACLLLFAGRNRFQYVVEKHSKDFLAFTVALCVLPIFYLPPEGKLICLAFLLFITALQLIIATCASIEFIRFELLSPAWYMAEGAFIVGGIAIGATLGSLTELDSDGSTMFPLTLYLVVLANIFAQHFINRGNYPSSNQKRLVEVSPVQISIPKTNFESNLKEKGKWLAKVDCVGVQYNLSPRQIEILELLAKGRNAEFIQEYFCISKSTAKSHIYSIYCKLDIHSRQELIDIIETTELIDNERPVDL